MKNQQLNAGALIFFGVIVIPLIFNWLTCQCYKTSNRQVVAKTQQMAYFHYEALHSLYSNANMDLYKIIDVRPSESFSAGHLEGAMNIPFDELMDKKHGKLLKTDKPILIYADDQKLSVAARLMLLGQGQEEVFVIPGSYESIRAHAVEDFHPSRAFYNEDKAKFDFPRFMRLDPAVTERKTPGTSAVPGAEEISPVPGGC